MGSRQNTKEGNHKTDNSTLNLRVVGDDKTNPLYIKGSDGLQRIGGCQIQVQD